MLDPRFIRENLELLAERQARRNAELDVERIRTLEGRRKAVQRESERLQAERNERSKAIGQAKSRGDSIDGLRAEMGALAESLATAESDLEAVRAELDDILLAIPNVVDDSVPPGKSDRDNVEVRRVGEPREFGFDVRDHIALGERSASIDQEVAARLSGSRFAVLRGDVARLHRALAQMMLDTHVDEHGYTEINAPVIVNRDVLVGTGNLPKFAEDLFALEGEPERYLIPTSEAPLTNLVRDRILDESDLPLKFTCHSSCFRSEAGSYGRDTRGLIRLHQFEKVEMVQITRPEASWDALEEMTSQAETILKKLDLPYRVVSLCGGDIGFAAAKTYDLEVWLPGQAVYREISSCSNCTDFQARRMQARCRMAGSRRPELVHTLNGSGLAVGRALVAVMENYQQEDGSLTVPDVLVPYLGGRRVLLDA